MTSLESVGLSVDEFEAIRLKDLEGLEQTAAADSMRISQPTFHRVDRGGKKESGRCIGQWQSNTNRRRRIHVGRK